MEFHFPAACCGGIHSFLSLLRTARDMRGRRPDGVDDMLVTGAATDVSPDPFADLPIRGRRIIAQELQSAKKHPGSTKTALERVVF